MRHAPASGLAVKTLGRCQERIVNFTQPDGFLVQFRPFPAPQIVVSGVILLIKGGLTVSLPAGQMVRPSGGVV
jgi:hypothetical protein